MTDVQALAKRLFKRIEWQSVPSEITIEDLTEFIAEAIEHLYVMTGRGTSITDDMFVRDNDLVISFAENLPADEKDYVIVTAQIDFFTKVQSDVSDLVGYSTDALAITHSDKPFANLQQRIDDLRREQDKIWYKMNRFHHLGGVVM